MRAAGRESLASTAADCGRAAKTGIARSIRRGRTAGPPGEASVRRVPWWGVISSALAPVLLVAGWTCAEALQPPTYDAVGGTVSALAAVGAADRWVMTLVFAVVADCGRAAKTGIARSIRRGRTAGPPGEASVRRVPWWGVISSALAP